MAKWPTHEEVVEKVEALEIPFSPLGVDPYGASKRHLALWATPMAWLYRNYFSVRVFGSEHVPARGRAMLVGHHSGGVALDGALLITSMLLDHHPPRLAQGMAEKFLNRVPFSSAITSRVGQLTGLPEHARRLLEDDRLLVVFPEGARGTAKLYPQRYDLVQFGTGFMRLAMATGTPIVPVAFNGVGEAIPTVFNSKRLGKLVGAPYVPFTPYLLPIPRKVPVQIYIGKPLVFDGDDGAPDHEIEANVAQVKSVIAELIRLGVDRRQTGEFDLPIHWP
ncbi:MAG: lysophospholipid acyltransferase family protein [Bradymonadia bacterium]